MLCGVPMTDFFSPVQAFGRVFDICGDDGDELPGGDDGARWFSLQYLQVLRRT